MLADFIANRYHSHVNSSTPRTGKVTAAPETPRIPSAAILGPAGRAVILHNGREYVLRLTQSGTLILTA